ncbi:U7 snRNA-associated Sm-like protein LSm11 [Ambystoma mexicanum]|uniref:U7 snRNA-associated Sm-like protein LSm11 n=1 Tax=Ambystoma mexicanum TaxID=8296 RepID=UPI0037E7FBBF
MEEGERHRASRSRGTGQGEGHARGRDLSGPFLREGTRNPGKGLRGTRDSSDPFPREGGRGSEKRRYRARDLSEPVPREGRRSLGEARPSTRDSSDYGRREGGRTRAANDTFTNEGGGVRGRVRDVAPRDLVSREEGRHPESGRDGVAGVPLSRGGGRAGVPSDPHYRERGGASGGGYSRPARDRGYALETGRLGAPTDLFPGEGSRAAAVGNAGALSEPVAGEGGRTPRVCHAGLPTNASPREEADSPPGPELDVGSELFNPLLVLYSPKVPLPFPEIRAFNNLAEYESFQRRGRTPRSRGPAASKPRKGKKPPPDPERIQRLKSMIVSGDTKPQPRRKGHRGPKNVLTKMPLNEGSPLGELHRCVRDRVKVNVHIRTFKGLRGVCSGFLVAFDKFWNMALTDVDETYRKPVLGKAFSNEPQLTLTRLFDRLKVQEDSKTTTEALVAHQDYTTSASMADARYGSPPGGHDTTSRSNRGQCSRMKDAELHLPSGKQAGKTPVANQVDIRSSTYVKGQTLTRSHRPKVDYQQVHTRHINQMFIRGENILLIHLAK